MLATAANFSYTHSQVLIIFVPAVAFTLLMKIKRNKLKKFEIRVLNMFYEYS